MLCLCALGLLASTAASASKDLDTVQANMNTIMATKSPTPNPFCIIGKCGGHAAKCAVDHDCRSSLGCTAGCLIKDPKEQNQTCIFQCDSDFENQVYDDLIYCMFNKNDCMGTKKGFDEWQACKPIDKVTPITQYRGAPLTTEVARNILMRGTHKRGDWIVAKGQSAAYDCFDCQYLYWGYKPDNTMYYSANYKIHKSNGESRWNTANYVAAEWQGALGRYSMNASNYGGLEHEEDWRLLGADESDVPKWAVMYYCGAAAGVGEAYSGAFILTPDGNLPTDAKSMTVINSVLEKNGLTLKCKTDNSNCTGHPAPPGSTATLVV
jgi:hypothetical protein